MKIVDADHLSKLFGQALVNAGFRGTIEPSEARSIVKTVTEQFDNDRYNIVVELAPIHRVGKPTQINCQKSAIKVMPKQVKNIVQQPR